MKLRLHFLIVATVLLTAAGLAAAERIPSAPSRYFNDYAGVVSRPVADRLNAQLEQFERDSSNQLLVVIYPKMESDSSVEDYTVRVAQAWHVGQKGKDNGAVLFSFMQEHQLYLQVGYGLEGAIPDVTAKRIITQEIVPRFRAGDMDGGVTAAVEAMIAAAKGEYQGTGRTAAERRGSNPIGSAGLFALLFMLWIVFLFVRRGFNRPSVFMNPRRNVMTNTWWTGGSGGGSWGGGGSFGGGGGFSGGGGSFGGGGAGGKW
ncbi:MAG TPA: TPM domain-containing protein [Lacunisphaera sp.]